MPTLEQLYTLTGFQPNPAQHQAIHHVDGPLFLVAGPGSGKTRVLLWRTVNLIVFHGVKPEEIFLSTFTEKAADQLKNGLLSLLGLVTNQTGTPYDLSKMYIGTVHSLCNRLLTDRAFIANRSRREAPSVIDEIEQFFLLYHKRFWRDAAVQFGVPSIEEACDLVNQYFKETEYQQTSRYKAASALQSLFNRFSEENLEPSEIELQHPDPTVRLFAKAYGLYLEQLKPRTDLSLLQQAAYRRSLEQSQSRLIFKHIIVDEYQDTNSIQERLFFSLAGHKNICVVGDDEQALYRFRGATVENFVQFPERCQSQLQASPTRIALATNYRSRSEIVSFYRAFMNGIAWQRPQGGHYRIEGKNIQAHSRDEAVAVVASSNAKSDVVAAEIADLVVNLKERGLVSDYNQIAFLFPSLKAALVGHFIKALEERGVKSYAPRAKRFLEADEPTAILGLLAEIIGRSNRDADFDKGDYREYHNWLDSSRELAKQLMADDQRLAAYIKDRKADVQRSIKDHQALMSVIASQSWDTKTLYRIDTHKRALASATSLSENAKRMLTSSHLDALASRGVSGEGRPITLHYIVNRVTSLDWNLLDVFYRITGFDHFKAMFDLAEDGKDEGPICNLSLTSALIARFLDLVQSVPTADLLKDNMLANLFFGSYIFARFRMGEGETEAADDPFPRGRVPFLTIHQSKGLEFPVVILGNLGKKPGAAQANEVIIRPLLTGEPEPLERVSEFDTMRMYYVALSRAQNLMVLANPKGHASYTPNHVFLPLLATVKRLGDLDLDQIPSAKAEVSDISHTYSFTGDYLSFLECPRRYMIFRKYNFAASRTQAMFFGNLVHQTIEDLHNRLIAARNQGAKP
jgi:DNA helicase II / ATP-dependent DNA helicase PcrA